MELLQYALSSPVLYEKAGVCVPRHLCAFCLSVCEQQGPIIFRHPLVITASSFKNIKKLDSSRQGSLWETVSLPDRRVFSSLPRWGGRRAPVICAGAKLPESTLATLQRESWALKGKQGNGHQWIRQFGIRPVVGPTQCPGAHCLEKLQPPQGPSTLHSQGLPTTALNHLMLFRNFPSKDLFFSPKVLL